MVPNGDMGDGEVSRDGTRLAVTSDYGANTKLAFFAVTGDVKTEFPPAFPEAACATTNGDEKYADPTWSPDGSGLAYQSSKGIETTRFTQFGGGTCATGSDGILSATGSEPDWGPADPPAAAYVAPAPGPSPTPGPVPVKPAAGAKLVIAKVTAKSLRKGLPVTVSVPSPGKVSVTALVSGRKVASGRATAKKAGKVTVKLTKVKKSLKGKTLTLKLSFKGGTVTKTLKVR